MKQALKNWIKTPLAQPRGVTIGTGSTVRLPRWIYNRSRVEIGRDCFDNLYESVIPLRSTA